MNHEGYRIGEQKFKTIDVHCLLLDLARAVGKISFSQVIIPVKNEFIFCSSIYYSVRKYAFGINSNSWILLNS